MVESKCPWCNRIIGGKNYKTHDRSGHKNLNDVDANAYIQKFMNNYEAN